MTQAPRESSAGEAAAAQQRDWPRHEERSEAAPSDIALPPTGASLPVAREAPAAVVASAGAPRTAPPVPHFDLPTHELEQIADGAGLQWVQSDADKVRSVQQAIAAEPMPEHVPRERKPVALPDDGPLVLVETRKDLSELALPFERQAAAAQAQQPL
jgi:ribonuclease E